jgi:hypothetical protein
MNLSIVLSFNCNLIAVAKDNQIIDWEIIKLNSSIMDKVKR